MKILFAPNALKGSCGAGAAARALARGARRAAPQAELVAVPVADGGDGLLELAIDAWGARRIPVRVTGPCFAPVEAALAWVPERRLALIEMALASGLALVPEAERNPLLTTTRGTGELIRAALDLGAETLLVGIGGSATTDGGIGMASALGYRFLDAAGREVAPTGAGLAALARIDASGADQRLARVDLQAVCDVDNPLTGPRGAAAVYGPQKGASPAQVARLDAGLVNLAALVAEGFPKDSSAELASRALAEQPGAGAAGGLGFGLQAFCGARLRPGAELVLEMLEFDRHLVGTDLVLTAEGRLDSQTLAGKAPALVAARARHAGIPCIAIAGSLEPGLPGLADRGFTAVLSLCPGPLSLADAMARTEELLEEAAEQVVRIFLAGRQPRREFPDST
ncbi:MAG: glycerate kinase [Gammaproteobacteria bacterium]|jgi:glycerate kinase|nr:glycerate kinase [Gammaproteobacteria bacterium]